MCDSILNMLMLGFKHWIIRKDTVKDFDLSEAALTRAELIKPSKNVTGKTRAEDVYAHVKRGEPFQTVKDGRFNGAAIELEFINSRIEKAFRDGNVDNIPSGEVFQIVSDPSTKVKLSDLQKTKEFGSSRGSGGGAASTAITEPLQALYFSYVLNINKGIIRDAQISIDELEKAYRYIRTPKTFEKLIESSEFSDEDWQKTFVQSANDYYSWYNSNRNASGPYFIHRDSSFMNSIYDKFRKLQKKEGLSLQNDKWNPGDVWLSTSKGEAVITERHDTLRQYNEAVNQAYMSGDLMGISLKKLGGPKAKIKEFNIPNVQKHQAPGIRLITLNGERGAQSFFGNAKLILETTDNRKIDFRSFSRDSSWQGEIKGKAAAGGKVSHGPINNILKMLNIEQLPPQKKITSIARKPNDRFYREFYGLFQKYAKESREYSLEEFVAQIETMDPGDQDAFRFSKYMGSKFLDILTRNKQKVSDVLAEIFNYAESSTSVSSAFVKIF